jgi:hypothetical protein
MDISMAASVLPSEEQARLFDVCIIGMSNRLSHQV